MLCASKGQHIDNQYNWYWIICAQQSNTEPQETVKMSDSELILTITLSLLVVDSMFLSPSLKNFAINLLNYNYFGIVFTLFEYPEYIE